MIFNPLDNYVATNVTFIPPNALFLLLLPYKYDTIYTHSCFGDHGDYKHGESYLLIPTTYLLNSYLPIVY
jgi:hypothetical protein